MQYLNFIDSEFLQGAIGAKEQEINNLEAQMSINLPRSLKELFLIMGKKQTLFDYCDLFGVDEMEEIQTLWQSIIDENIQGGFSTDLPPQKLAFFYFQDTFFFVDLGQVSDDPIVYAYDDVGNAPVIRKVANSLSELVKTRLNDK